MENKGNYPKIKFRERLVETCNTRTNNIATIKNCLYVSRPLSFLVVPLAAIYGEPSISTSSFDGKLLYDLLTYLCPASLVRYFLLFVVYESFYVVFFTHCYFCVLTKRKGRISLLKEASHQRD